MVFKRRDPRGPVRIVAEALWPRGGWRRAASYITLRLRRLPDSPHKIARGVACGVFVCFTPLFGLHFGVAALMAWAIRGNILASLLATLVGNPLTFPLIAALSIGLGERLLQSETPVPLPQVLPAFSRAFGQITDNLVALLTGGSAQWDQLAVFFKGVFVPYLVGGFVPGVIAAFVAYKMSVPVVAAYQRRRAGTLSQVAKRRMNADGAP